MQIAIASGKGGTGKTTLATNLAIVASRNGKSVHLIDCDVEEPNCHLFLKPSIERSEKVTVAIPEVDDGKCTGCGDCGRICQYNAIVCINKKVLVFPELCHSCGGCWLVCPEHAINKGTREVGLVEIGVTDSIRFSYGILRVGEVMSPPLIKAVKATQNGNSALTIIDSPPGTSCPVIEAISDVDYVVLVTEPTPFGLNDLGLALDMVKALGIPHAVVVNRHQENNHSARDFCKARAIEIIAEIPDDRRVAEAYSRGESSVLSVPGHKELFINLLKEIESLLRIE